MASNYSYSELSSMNPVDYASSYGEDITYDNAYKQTYDSNKYQYDALKQQGIGAETSFQNAMQDISRKEQSAMEAADASAQARGLSSDVGVGSQAEQQIAGQKAGLISDLEGQREMAKTNLSNSKAELDAYVEAQAQALADQWWNDWNNRLLQETQLAAQEEAAAAAAAAANDMMNVFNNIGREEVPEVVETVPEAVLYKDMFGNTAYWDDVNQMYYYIDDKGQQVEQRFFQPVWDSTNGDYRSDYDGK